MYIEKCFSMNERIFNISFRLIWFGWVWFYGISTIVGYLMPNPFYTYILNINMIWFRCVSWYINHCRLYNDKSFIYIYIYIYGLVWFGWVLWLINYCRLFNAKSFLYVYIILPPAMGK